MTERYQVSAVPVSGGERVTGYYARFYNGMKVKYIIYPGYAEIDSDGYYPDAYEVDPATIEPVMVKAKNNEEDIYGCPNCDKVFWFNYGFKHCPDCGQALDWGDTQ